MLLRVGLWWSMALVPKVETRSVDLERYFMEGGGRAHTGVLSMALKVLTTNEQPAQSTELVDVMVEA